MLNGVITAFLGVYLAIVVIRGNSQALVSQLGDDIADKDGEAGFIKWGVSVIILVWLVKNDKTRGIGVSLASLAVISYFVLMARDGKLDSFRDGFYKAWASLSFGSN